MFYNISNDEIVGFEDLGDRSFKPAINATVFMIRGIISKRKQPISYFLHETTCPSKHLKDTIESIIQWLHVIGLRVRIFVTDDLGPNYLKLPSLLGVTAEKPYFCNKNEKVVYRFDTPHLLKATSNNLQKKKKNFKFSTRIPLHLNILYNFLILISSI